MMKRVLASVFMLMFCTFTFAGDLNLIDYEINSGEATRVCARKYAGVFNLSNARAGEPLQINLRDLSNDSGPAMKFRISVYSSSAGGVDFSAISEGDAAFIVPGKLVQEQTMIAVFDNNRSYYTSNGTVDPDPLWPAQEVGFTAMQDVPEFPEIDAYTKDHHIGHPSIYVWSLFLKNVGSVALENPTARYYFTVENGVSSLELLDYYTPNSTLRLLQVPGTNEYALEYDFNGVTLQPGETTKGHIDNQVQLYYTGYQTIDKANDYSNTVPAELFYHPHSTYYMCNRNVSVYNQNGSLVAGTELPGYSKDQFVPVQ